MKGLILSGGKGTRLYPLTFTSAKQLIPVANKPVLFRVIEAIRDAGVTEIGIVVGDTASEIKQAVRRGNKWGVEITYIPQDAPLGLAHAVKISRDFLGDERFVMFLGDNVIQGGISPLLRQFAASDWNSQIVLTEVSQPERYGVAELNDQGQIIRLIENGACGHLHVRRPHLRSRQCHQALLAWGAGDHGCDSMAGGEGLPGLPLHPPGLVD